MELKQLSAAIVLAKLFVLDLCVVRAAEDLPAGTLTAEGAFALAIACPLVVSLGCAALRARRIRPKPNSHFGDMPGQLR